MSGTDLSSLRLHVRYDEGSGPVIVLLHGINSDATDWRPVIDLIGPDYRCIAPDVLGFGESPKPLDIEYTADEHAAVLEATLAELGIRERFVLIGYSLGGDIAIRYASKWPDRLRRLFLLSTPFYLPPGSFPRRQFGPKYLQELIAQSIWRLVARQKETGGFAYTLASGRLEDFAKGFLRTDDVSEHWDIMSKNLVNTIGGATFIDDLPQPLHAHRLRARRPRPDRPARPDARAQAAEAGHGDPAHRRADRRPLHADEHPGARRRGAHA